MKPISFISIFIKCRNFNIGTVPILKLDDNMGGERINMMGFHRVAFTGGLCGRCVFEIPAILRASEGVPPRRTVLWLPNVYMEWRKHVLFSLHKSRNIMYGKPKSQIITIIIPVYNGVDGTDIEF
jgi:hypothetical protein